MQFDIAFPFEHINTNNIYFSESTIKMKMSQILKPTHFDNFFYIAEICVFSHQFPCMIKLIP